MRNRRHFLSQFVLGSVGIGLTPLTCSKEKSVSNEPLVVTTWNHKETNKITLDALNKGENALDAIILGIRKVEADPNDMSVGYGGRPDRDGHVTLDACVMNHKGEAGSACFVRDIKHPISLAKAIMEKTPHVILSGKGARKFALENGFNETDLLTPQAKKAYEDWLKEGKYKPIINIENHDTVGMISMDKNQNISGGCSTSGMAYKIHGRVGDSPIIGAGLFVDNDVGAATATGVGEMVLKTLGSFLVVELMRNGKTPTEACEEAVNRIVKKYDCKDIQVGYVALSKSGEYGAYAVQPGFIYTVTKNGRNEVLQSKSYY